MATHPGPKGLGPHGSPGSDSNRLLLTMLLTVGFISIMQVLSPPKAKPPQTADGGVAVQAPVGTDTADAAGSAGAMALTAAPGADGGPAGAAAPGAEATPPPAVDPELPEELVELDNGAVHLVVSTHGGRVVRAELPKFLEHEDRTEEGRPARPVNMATDARASGGQFRLQLAGVPADASYRITEQSAHSLTLERTGAGWKVVRTLAFKADAPHGVTMAMELHNLTGATRTASPALEMTAKVNKAEKGSGFPLFGMPTDQTTLLCQGPEDLMREVASGHEGKEPVKHPGSIKWAGMDRQYFLAAVVPGATGPLPDNCTGTVKDDNVRLALQWAPMDVPAGGSVTLAFDGYVGPKIEPALEAVNPVLRDSIDYGWFGALVRVLLKLLVWFHSIIPNYGVAVLLLTLTVKVVTLPLTQKSFVSAQRQKDLAPKLKELQAKYAHDRATLGQKQMEMFQANGVNPLGGCLPMLVQMPVWIALYRTLFTSVELYQQPFIPGWINDLTQRDPFYILPVTLAVVMFLQALQTPTPPDQPQMKYVQYGMPLVFSFAMTKFPSGLTLYMVSNAVLTIFQQAYIRRKFGKAAPNAVTTVSR